jgi:uncharacterized protein (TIGR02594 family)
MASEAPDWLLTMRSISGLSEKPGTADEPKIMAMADEIARIFPDMSAYCDQYNHDSIPWCGLCAAYVMAKAGIRPPFVAGRDTDCFLWARSWADANGYTLLKTPRLGCVVVLTRAGGGHVSLYESTSGSNYMLRGGNQSDAINLAAFPKSNVVALVWPSAEPIPAPIVPPADTLPVLRKGDSGIAVVRLQELLPKWVDGDFGTTTENLVREFQRSEGLEADGVVGEQTWAALLDEEPPLIVVPPLGEEGWVHNITATWFGGSSETENSAYPPYDAISATELSVALPCRFTGTLPQVEVMNEDGEIILAKIRDVGPWMIDDNYWDKGTRPVAEMCYASKTPIPRGPQKGRVPSNPAGIDLSAALAEALEVDGMGKVSWRLVR